MFGSTCYLGQIDGSSELVQGGRIFLGECNFSGGKWQGKGDGFASIVEALRKLIMAALDDFSIDAVVINHKNSGPELMIGVGNKVEIIEAGIDSLVFEPD